MWLQKINNSRKCDICTKTFTDPLLFQTHKILCKNGLSAAATKDEILAIKKQKVSDPDYDFKPSVKDRDDNFIENNSHKNRPPIILKTKNKPKELVNISKGVIPVLYFNDVNEKTNVFMSSNEKLEKVVNGKNWTSDDKNITEKNIKNCHKDDPTKLKHKKVTRVDEFLEKKLYFSDINGKSESFVSSNDKLEKVVNGKNETNAEKIKAEQTIGKSNKDIPANLHNQKLAKVEGLLKKEFQDRFVNLKNERNDLIMKHTSKEQLINSSKFIEDVVVAKEMCDNDLINLGREINFTNEEAQEKANLYLITKIKYDFLMKKVLNFVNCFIETKVNEPSKNVKIPSEIKLDRFEETKEIEREEKTMILTKSEQSKLVFKTIVESMIGKSSLHEGYKCLKCDREFDGNHAKQHAISHVDNLHTPHLLHKCLNCDLILKTNTGLTRHIGALHKNDYKRETKDKEKIIPKEKNHLGNEKVNIGQFEDQHKKIMLSNMRKTKILRLVETEIEETNVKTETFKITEECQDTSVINNANQETYNSNIQLNGDLDDSKKMIFTKSDKDKVRFRTIVESMIYQVSLDDGYKCLVCDKRFAGQQGKPKAVSHVDHKHTDHLLHKCHICDLIVKSSYLLTKHIRKVHRGSDHGESSLSRPHNENLNNGALLKGHRKRKKVDDTGISQTSIKIKETEERIPEHSKRRKKKLKKVKIEKTEMKDNSQKIILTTSDEDKGQFQVIVESMIRKNSSDEGYQCLMCERSFNASHAKQHVISHVDHMHTNHLLHKCHICDLILKSRDSLSRHIGKVHKSGSPPTKGKFKKSKHKKIKQSLPSTTPIIINTEGLKIKKEKMEPALNESDMFIKLNDPLEVQENSSEHSDETGLPEADLITTLHNVKETNIIEKINNIDSLQRPKEFKFNIPIPNRDMTQKAKPSMEIPDVMSSFDTIIEESQIKPDLNDSCYSENVNTEEMILTKSDEDNAQFQIIVESLISKISPDGGYKCLKCDRQFDGKQAKPHAVCHVDRRHTDHLLHKCHLCDLIVKSRDNLNRHIGKLHSRAHKNPI